MDLVSLEPPHSADSESLNLTDLRAKKCLRKNKVYEKKTFSIIPVFIYFFFPKTSSPFRKKSSPFRKKSPQKKSACVHIAFVFFPHPSPWGPLKDAAVHG